MAEIGIGVVGGGYMGKAHAVAMAAVAAVFDTKLRPRLEVICTTSPKAARNAQDLRLCPQRPADWRDLVAEPAVKAMVIASPAGDPP
jgi:predicted dehydrogenase